jgi:hypothetical protein
MEDGKKMLVVVYVVSEACSVWVERKSQQSVVLQQGLSRRLHWPDDARKKKFRQKNSAPRPKLHKNLEKIRGVSRSKCKWELL